MGREGEERLAAELCSKRDAILQPCRSMLWPGNRGSFTPQWRPRGGSSRRCGRIKRAEFRLRPMLKTKSLFFGALRFASHLAVFAGFVLVWPAGFLARPHSVLHGFVFSRCLVAPPVQFPCFFTSAGFLARRGGFWQEYLWGPHSTSASIFHAPSWPRPHRGSATRDVPSLTAPVSFCSICPSFPRICRVRCIWRGSRGRSGGG